MSFILYLFIAFIALSALVFFHELGHYSAAKFFGVHVERFSIGFGKIIARKTCCNTEWVFSAIPMGGYVKMKGQDDTNPTLSDNLSDSYTSKKPWQRIVILLAGPMANFVLAFFVYFALALGSAPTNIAHDYVSPTIGDVVPDSPANRAGLISKDKIISINSQPINFWYQIGAAINSNSRDTIFDIDRNGSRLTIKVTPETMNYTDLFHEKVTKKIVGISPHIERNTSIDFTLPQSIQYAWHETVKGSTMITKSVQKMSTGDVDSKELGGVLSIFDIIISFTQKGIPYLLSIMALLSINLGVMNLLPIPALDGGHIMLNLYEIIFRRPPSQSAVGFITMLGWMLLLALMSLGLYNDINRLWG